MEWKNLVFSTIENWHWKWFNETKVLQSNGYALLLDMQISTPEPVLHFLGSWQNQQNRLLLQTSFTIPSSYHAEWLALWSTSFLPTWPSLDLLHLIGLHNGVGMLSFTVGRSCLACRCATTGCESCEAQSEKNEHDDVEDSHRTKKLHVGLQTKDPIVGGNLLVG